METIGTIPPIFPHLSIVGTVPIIIRITILFIARFVTLIHGQIHIIAPDGQVHLVTIGDHPGIMVGAQTWEWAWAWDPCMVIRIGTMLGVHHMDMVVTEDMASVTGQW